MYYSGTPRNRKCDTYQLTVKKIFYKRERKNYKEGDKEDRELTNVKSTNKDRK
jgi:hypothetical protein